MLNKTIESFGTGFGRVFAVCERPYIKKGEIAVLVGRHETTVSRAIGHLTKRGLVERVGSNKTGWWRVVQ